MVMMIVPLPIIAVKEPTEIRIASAKRRKQTFLQDFLHEVKTGVVQTDSLASSRETIFLLISELREKGHATGTGKDEQQRPIFVSTQGAIENSLSSFLGQGKIKKVIGIIHTPTPATPLCTKEGEISEHLVHPSFAGDEKRCHTIYSRAHIIRSYLNRGGILYVVYPKEGIFKRTPEQRGIYKQELLNHPYGLFDVPITEELPPDAVGATYFITTADDDKIMFSIKASQANAPDDEQCWEMWFADIHNEDVQGRARKVLAITQDQSNDTSHRNLAALAKTIKEFLD